MKRVYIITLLCCLLVIYIFGGNNYKKVKQEKGMKVVDVGFIYIGDESTPYTSNFINVEKYLATTYGNKVKIHAITNVTEGNEGVPLQQLVDEGCDIIFATSYGYQETVKEFAAKYPDIEFCQATGDNIKDEPVLDNYHTFMGHIYEGRYVCGVIAGMKLKELINDGVIAADQAKVGYVAPFPYAEVISGYTAFYMGVHSEVPQATMNVIYTNSWNNYNLEKKAASRLINNGCIIISQGSDTIGPAIACETATVDHPVYHVGYNQSTVDVAPTSSLISCRINWQPYIVSAVDAVMRGHDIEADLAADINGNDAGAGFDHGWVEMLELNNNIATEGSDEVESKLIAGFENKSIEVFAGDFTGTDPLNSSDTISLTKPYKENEGSSAPSFHYVLDDVITIIE